MLHRRKTFTESDCMLGDMSAANDRNWGGTDDPLTQLGRKVADRREELKYSQPRLLELMNATPYRPGVKQPSHISNIENGSGDKLPSIRALAALAVALETNLDYLAGLTNDPKPATDLEDQVVVGVDDPHRRAQLQEVAELLAGFTDDDFATLVWLVRRLAGGAERRGWRGKESAPGSMTEGAKVFARGLLTEQNQGQEEGAQVRQRRTER